jgi:DNA replicative helicase MCM subunit Mcm2 (Cdc46/Mcm family)
MTISERATAGQMRHRIVTDDDVDKALSFLRDSAIQIGQARQAMIMAQRLVERTEALLTLASEQTSDAKRKADARASEKWQEATTEEAIAAGEYEKLRALREAANAKIEAWRSEQANYRNMKI